MEKRIILTADSICDLSPELKQKYDVRYSYAHIIIDGKNYNEGIDITPEDIYDTFKQTRVLPKTAAINIAEYIEFFKKFVEQGYEVIHISMGSQISACHQNAFRAAEEVGNVYAIDGNLTTGNGLLLIEAGERIARGMSARQIAKEINELKENVHASFILDRLEYMRAGGRCSTVELLGANLLGIKPCIEIDNKNGGKMGVGKKYRGKFNKVLIDYIDEKLDGRAKKIDPRRVFITHSGVSKEIEKLVYDHVASKGIFKKIYITRTSCTVSCHCGPNTLGVIFMSR